MTTVLVQFAFRCCGLLGDMLGNFMKAGFVKVLDGNAHMFQTLRNLVVTAFVLLVALMG